MFDFTWNNARAVRRLFGAATCAAVVLAVPGLAAAGDEEGCLDCHGLAGFAVRESGKARALGIAAGRFDVSMHADIGCRECHVDIVSIPHGGEHRDVGCGQPCHGLGVGGREVSHEGLYWEYTASAHGSARSRKIGCLVCHPSPERRETAERDKMGEARQCAACHQGSPKVASWFTDRHFLALAGGNRRAPSCPDCHSAHRVRTASAPESSVNRKHLAETCSNGALGAGRKGGCHGTLGESGVAGASMNPLPRGRTGKNRLALVLTLLAGALAAGLVVRAGVGLARGR
ncbi:MAG: cytochrome c3 family protein [Candidatus Methylomirabilia bacterium]